MKKILCASLVFASACILVAQQGNNSGEFCTETRMINRQMSVIITGYNGTSTQIHIPDQINGLPVVAIGDNAFRSRRIESVTFPSTLVSIGNYAFYGNNLKAISIPPAVITIGIGAFDSNALGGNASGNASSKKKGTARTFTIEPAHSETMYRPNPNQSAPESVNIIVIPGYNPLQSSTSPSGGVVTVQQFLNSLPVATPPATTPNQTVPATNQTIATPPAVTPNQTGTAAPANPLVLSDLSQQPSAQPQQQHGVQQTSSPSNKTSRLNVIPEHTIDLSTGLSSEETPEEERKPIKLYKIETYDIERIPIPR
ncbi:MAG: leucine-rich repeat domain-containing protein [Spirochaetaceae bacterium]|jgi:hypothetical protein|nr:leucine-rich repeat domain-containing protein [Spirochaetaceae bacterium]